MISGNIYKDTSANTAAVFMSLLLSFKKNKVLVLSLSLTNVVLVSSF